MGLIEHAKTELEIAGFSEQLIQFENKRIIKVPVPKEIWDADMSIWNVLFGRRDIMGAWMNSIKDVIKQIDNK
jgi:hypothetical protein